MWDRSEHHHDLGAPTSPTFLDMASVLCLVGSLAAIAAFTWWPKLVALWPF